MRKLPKVPWNTSSTSSRSPMEILALCGQEGVNHWSTLRRRPAGIHTSTTQGRLTPYRGECGTFSITYRSPQKPRSLGDQRQQEFVELQQSPRGVRLGQRDVTVFVGVCYGQDLGRQVGERCERMLRCRCRAEIKADQEQHHSSDTWLVQPAHQSSIMYDCEAIPPRLPVNGPPRRAEKGIDNEATEDGRGWARAVCACDVEGVRPSQS
ncbi:hypothetical protein EYF80_016983 [Liparis tanakae]|uniref:Uncharacterized protein n=1 Tax=Liparis tanakae TaxID=230148 RepID=A0A4Z2I6F4_9TELE|nr:hypothetical protein EYF80_016983 [Liparis tanakae]